MRGARFRPASLVAAGALLVVIPIGIGLSVAKEDPTRDVTASPAPSAMAAAPSEERGAAVRAPRPSPVAPTLEPPAPTAAPDTPLGAPRSTEVVPPPPPPAEPASPVPDPADASVPAVGAPEPVGDEELLQQTTCGLRASAIGSLLDGAPTAADDQVRDAAAVLDDRVALARQAAEAQPQLVHDLEVAERVLAWWLQAIAALDNGDQAAADEAMRLAAAEIDQARSQALAEASC